MCPGRHGPQGHQLDASLLCPDREVSLAPPLLLRLHSPFCSAPWTAVCPLLFLSLPSLEPAANASRVASDLPWLRPVVMGPSSQPPSEARGPSLLALRKASGAWGPILAHTRCFVTHWVSLCPRPMTHVFIAPAALLRPPLALLTGLSYLVSDTSSAAPPSPFLPVFPSEVHAPGCMEHTLACRLCICCSFFPGCCSFCPGRSPPDKCTAASSGVW